MHKQLFDDAIGEVPPSTVDVDAVIVRGRRAARVRRVANPAVAAGVAVVLLTGVVAYTLTGDDGAAPTTGTPPTSPGTTPPGTTPGTTPSGTTPGTPPPTSGPITLLPPGPGDVQPTAKLPPACERTDLETAQALSARLTEIATGTFQAQRPDATLEVNFGSARGRQPLEFYQVAGSKVDDSGPICGPDTYSMALATTRGPEGVGNMMIIIEPSYYARDTLKCDGVTAGETSCEVVTNSAGDAIRKSTPEYEGGTKGNHVQIIRADGTSIMLTADNIGTSIKTGGAPTATEPPLTLDQLVEIGTAPGMTLFP